MTPPVWRGRHVPCVASYEVPMSQNLQIAGLEVSQLDLGAFAARICSEAQNKKCFSVFTLNLDHIVKLKSDTAFREAYERARFISADGFPIVLAGRLKGHGLKRVTGSDVIDPVCALAASQGLPIYLLGSTDTVLETAVQRLKTRHPGLIVAGYHAPPFGFDPVSEAADDVVERVRKSGAAICFVALGAPKQELFADHASQAGPGPAMLCIGAGLDFIAGKQARAPALAQRLGAEWLWRLATDPRRLARRYLSCLVTFPFFLMEETLAERAKRRSRDRSGRNTELSLEDRKLNEP